MISVAEAKNLVQAHCFPLASVELSLLQANWLVLAEDIASPIDSPPFRQSAMDGYAIRFSDLDQSNEFIVTGELAAGDNTNIELSPGQATRIFTGARVPDSADTVVMKEKTTVQDKKVLINDPVLKKGANVRSAGSEIKSGEVALGAGTVLTPPAIGFLASLGITIVPVYKSPSAKIIVTGNELVQPGLPLPMAQVYEANSFAVRSALQQLRIDKVEIEYAKDDLSELEEKLRGALASADIVLLTGGVSAGDYDFVVRAAAECGVTQIFHRVAQKPGKPLYFGTRGKQIVFGLPGNPASVLTCFYEYVTLAIEKLTSRPSILKSIRLPLASRFEKNAGLTFFLKANCDQSVVEIAGAQESYKLGSFAKANCLVELADYQTVLEEGDLVDVHLLPS